MGISVDRNDRKAAARALQSAAALGFHIQSELFHIKAQDHNGLTPGEVSWLQGKYDELDGINKKMVAMHKRLRDT